MINQLINQSINQDATQTMMLRLPEQVICCCLAIDRPTGSGQQEAAITAPRDQHEVIQMNNNMKRCL
jgi:hypothetical protein